MEFLAFLTGLVVPKAFAATVDQIGAAGAGVAQMWESIRAVFPHTGSAPDAPWVLLDVVLAFVGSLLGGAAVASIIYGGIRLSTSGGDEGRMGEAKKIIAYALIGVILSVSAFSIIWYMTNVIIPAFVG